MNIKSLLIGSAAALVAVSGARAADAVVAEPEAVEYVRVCDAYGAGFFYIPGTETCLKIGGWVRYEIFADSGIGEGWSKRARAMLNFTASSETELGTLTSYIEMEAGNYSNYFGTAPVPSDYAFGLNHAWISLGGLKMGYSDTLWDWDSLIEGDSYGGAGVHFMSYTFSGGNGFSATLGLEQESWNTDFIPNVVGKLSYSAGMVSANLWAAYDDDDDIVGASSEFAVKANVDIKPSDALTLQVSGTYNSDDNFYSNGYDWSLGAAGKYQVNEKLALTLGGQYFGNAHGTSADDWTIGTVVDYTIVKDFSAKLALNYNDGDTVDGDRDGIAGDGYVSGFLRFQRSF